LLARRLVSLTGGEEQIADMIETTYGPESEFTFLGAAPDASRDAKDLIYEIFTRARPRLIAQSASIYAQHFTLPKLQGIVAFLETPAGTAFMEKSPIVMQESLSQGVAVGVDAKAELRRRFCAKHDCVRAPAAKVVVPASTTAEP
jgi:hypothetical protein